MGIPVGILWGFRGDSPLVSLLTWGFRGDVLGISRGFGAGCGADGPIASATWGFRGDFVGIFWGWGFRGDFLGILSQDGL